MNEDGIPTGSHIYSLDSPTLTVDILTGLQQADIVRVKQMGNFNEFCRVKFNASIPFDESPQQLQGSRCSPKSAWRSRGDVSLTGNNWSLTPNAENLVELGHATLDDPQ